MKYKYILLFLLSLITSGSLLAQCYVKGTANPTSIICGDCATLSAYDLGHGALQYAEDFNAGIAPQGWSFTSQLMFNNPCSPYGVDSTTHVWMGNDTSVPRAITTLEYNLTGSSTGATFCFDMLFAMQGNASPCEGPDEPQEGVYLQYSINNGATWVTFNYFDPNGGNDPSLVYWNNWCFQVPAAALVPAVKFRWYQDSDSGNDYDHWGIDNVRIYFNDPNISITWLHDNYTYPIGTGGANPNQVCPHTTTDYVVEMTAGANTCRDTVRVTVVNPVINVNAGRDTTICPGTCVDLTGVANVVKYPAQSVTFNNGTAWQSTTNGFGGYATLEVYGLNNRVLQSGFVQSVCINSAVFLGYSISPPAQIGLDDIRFELICPDSSVIVLVPEGTLTGTAIGVTCFVPVGGNSLPQASSPYVGNFAPAQPFANLNGCSSNGVWTLVGRYMGNASVFGNAVGNGFTMSFNEPEVSYPAIYVWSPTTVMTNSNTLTPTLCPTATGMYVLTANDTSGCTVASDTVTVTVPQMCCSFTLSLNITQPTCGANNGSVIVTPSIPNGVYTYAWSGSGNTTANISGLAPGNYSVTVTDSSGCSTDASFTLQSSMPTIDTVLVINESCAGENDGRLNLTVTGGLTPYTYAWSNGNTTEDIAGLMPSAYSVTVADANGCTVSSYAIVGSGPNCPFRIQVYPPGMSGDSAHTPFLHGVASGDPLSDAVLLWTRVTPDSGITSPIILDWEIATDSAFTNIVNSGSGTASANHDYTLTVDATGLRPRAVYYYRFQEPGGNYSRLGRTQTAPAPNSSVDSMKVAVLSCSSIFSGYFNAYARLAERTDVDLVIHMGDYIYDFVDEDEEVRVPVPYPTEPVTVDEWRDRHEYYLMDPDLREARAKYPWVVMWDNHDADVPQPNNGETAFLEWVPIRLTDTTKPNEIYRYLEFGDLFDLHMLDMQHFRDVDTIAPGETSALGTTQYNWLVNSWQASTKKWNLLGSQKMTGGWYSRGIPPSLFPNNGNVFDPNSWDGYFEERRQLFSLFDSLGRKNNVFVSGDAHISMAMDLAIDPFDSLQYNHINGNGGVGVEFLPTSISRGNFDEQGIDPVLAAAAVSISMDVNPHHVYMEVIQHGYGLLNIKKDSVTAEFWYSPILQPTTIEALGQSLVIEDGAGHWKRNLPILGTPMISSAATEFVSQIRPNPAQSWIEFDVASEYPMDAQITMYNINGKKVKYSDIRVSAGGSSYRIYIGDLAQAVYILQVVTAEGSMIRQFVKE